MQIAHASIPADNPAEVARVLALMLEGEAVRFPPGGPDAWMAWAKDGAIELEITLRGQAMTPGPEGGEWRNDGCGRRFSEAHIAICVGRSESEILEVAKAAGWPARHCERGGGYFNLAEVWVEGAFLIEFLDPEQTAIYKERVTPENWKAFLASQSPAA
jgi:hypothetical protein